VDESASIIGIDLGGTKIAAARYHASSWEEEESLRRETEASQGFEHVLDELLEVIEQLKTDSTNAIGIGVPGLVHHPEGTILKLPNIPDGENVPLQQLLSERAAMPCLVDNDANCFTLAESISGAGKDCSVVVGVTLGTGVGGGIVIDGKIFQGSQGFASEFGHMLLVPGQPPYDTEDKRGDVEQFFSGSAMGKRCKKAKSPEDYLGGEVCAFMQPDIFREVAWMCTNLIHVLDPSVIIFGGSAGRALAPHFSEVEKELKNWLLPDTPIPTLKVASLKNAATLGAAMLTIGK
jgi:glucokinase